jgi:hypothetical protein
MYTVSVDGGGVKMVDRKRWRGVDDVWKEEKFTLVQDLVWTKN